MASEESEGGPWPARLTIQLIKLLIILLTGGAGTS